MRTARPRHLIHDHREGPSATDVAISTPRFSGPGCMTMTSGLRQAHDVFGEAEVAASTRERREVARRPAAPAGCRSIITTSASRTPSARRVDSSAPSSRTRAAAASAARPGAPARRVRAARRCSIARRGCAAGRRTIATVSPAMLPLVLADGEAVEQCLRRVLVAPSPALMIGQRDVAGQQLPRPTAGGAR